MENERFIYNGAFLMLLARSECNSDLHWCMWRHAHILCDEIIYDDGHVNSHCIH